MPSTENLGRIPVSDIEAITRTIVAQGHLNSGRAVILHDLDRLRAHIDAATAALPNNTLHAIAVKANPILKILEAAVAYGGGLECASIEEVELSIAAGCPVGNILFDSPAKTVAELERALQVGVMINADNAEELARIDKIIQTQTVQTQVIGLRINPGVGSGTISATSVAGPRSRFGMSLVHDRAAIDEAFRRYEWLNGIHVHVGSQGCDPAQLVAGAKRALELANELNRQHDNRITTLDIGGGLPVAYLASDPVRSFADYGRALRQEIPELFDGRYRVVTEFGRAIQANCGTTLSCVEYVKDHAEGTVVVLHVGADMFMRPVYASADWKHEFVVMTPDGTIKQGPLQEYSIVGPLCFGGDIIEQSVQLPTVIPGDIVAIRDTGAYTLSLWSRHCNRGMPAVLGYRGATHDIITLRAPESPQDIVVFWG